MMKRCFKEKVITICTIIILVFIAVFVFGSTTTSADSNLRVNERKFFTSYVVKSGDTLWEIANNYITPEYTDTNEYIREIITSNQMDSTDIYPGQLMLIPYYADAPID